MISVYETVGFSVNSGDKPHLTRRKKVTVMGPEGIQVVQFKKRNWLTFSQINLFSLLYRKWFHYYPLAT